MDFYHIPVLADEVLKELQVKPGGLYFDGTCGGGGHSALIAENGGRLLCADRDADAIRAARKKLADFESVTFVRDNFANISAILEKLEIAELDGALLDLGVSSWQVDKPERGFSFLNTARLDMRMDQTAELSAFDVVNNYDEKRLRRVLWEYGEERFYKRITSKILEARETGDIETTTELADIVGAAIPRGLHEKHKHPATRTFQAIRIEVNGELGILEQALRDIAKRLAVGARFCVITFHSLEDRIVKNTFRNLADPCECPKTMPYCVCDKLPSVKLIGKKAIVPSQEEITKNPRSRSAKLRIVQKI